MPMNDFEDLEIDGACWLAVTNGASLKVVERQANVGGTVNYEQRTEPAGFDPWQDCADARVHNPHSEHV